MFNEELEVKIKMLNSSKFESLIEEIIEREYGEKEEFSINHIGKVIGKDVSRQGTPDIAFIFNDSRGKEALYFVEVTTEQGNIATENGKIKNDLNKCKALIQSNDLDVKYIIFACTSLIGQDRIAHYNTYCKSFCGGFKFWGMTAIVNKLKKYEDLAIKYLGVSVMSGNVKLLDTYINEKKLGVIETNPFKFREKEKEQIFNALKEKNIVLLVGPSGCGKTRLAIEVAKEIGGKKSCNAYWAFDCSEKINNDIAGFASKNKKSVIIVDDANRKPSSIEALRFVEQYKNVYVILTLRDYVFESFKEQARDIAFAAIVLQTLDNKQIADIVKDGFNIYNPKYLNYIVDIAKGNLRFAIMTAEVITHSKDSVSSIPEVLESYYKSIVQSVKFDENNELASTLVAISFLKTFDIRDDNLVKQICGTFRIQQSNLFQYLDDLNEVELIRLFHDKHRVEISDQILADYLCFRLIILQKKVTLTDIFKSFYIDYRSRCLDMIQSLVNIYGNSDELISEVKAIKEVFSGSDKLVDYYKIFIKLFPTEGIDYCYTTLREYNGEIQYSKFYNDEYGGMLDLIANQFEEDDSAMNYLIDLLKEKPKQKMAILASFSKNLTMTAKSFGNKFKAQIAFLKKCLKLVESSLEYCDALYTIVELYFPLSFECHEVQHDRDTNEDKLSIYRIAYPVDNASMELRGLVWNAFELLYKNGYMAKLSKLMENNCYMELDSKLLEMDKAFALDLLDKLPKTTLYEQIFCLKLILPYRNVDAVFEYYDKFGVSLGAILYKKYVCPIIGNRIFQEELVNEFLEILSRYDNDEIEESIINLFLACDSNEIWSVREFTPYAFNLLYERDKSSYDKRVINFLNKAGDGVCQPMAILKNVGNKERLLQWLNESDLASKHTWIAQIYLLLNSAEINKKITDEAFDFFANKYERSVWGNEQLIGLQKFEVVRPGFCHDLLKIYLNNKDINCHFISTLFYGFVDLDNLLTLLQHDIALITEAYFFVLEHDGHADYDGKIANFLIQDNPENLSKLIELKLNNRNIYINFRNFYELPDFIGRFLECMHNAPYIHYDIYVVEEVRNFSDGLYEKFINTVISKYIADIAFLADIASIICSCGSDRQIWFLDELIKANIDNETLSKLRILGYPNSWSGSIVPHIQNNIDALSEYIKGYRNSIQYLPFLHRLLDELHKWKTAEEIQEYNRPY